MPRLDAEGVQLHYQTLGEGSDVVMLHGLLTGSLASWYYTLAPALAVNHRVTLFDMRGHGLSDKPSIGYDSETLSVDLEHVINRVCRPPCVLIGQSFGALVAIRYALRFPDKVKRLVIIELPLPPSQSSGLSELLSCKEMIGR